MSRKERAARRTEAAAVLAKRENRDDATRVVASLSDGLDLLRESFFVRVHSDVEKTFGVDSVMMPVSEVKSAIRTKTQIDVYQSAEAAVVVRDNGYIGGDDAWFLQWMGALRLGDTLADPGISQQLAEYWSKNDDDRRRTFSVVIERTFPEAMRAPLVMYRLFPFAVSIATAVAFGDQVTAQSARRQQKLLLSSIGDCNECHGLLLESGEKCVQCGNPFWKYAWLTAD